MARSLLPLAAIFLMSLTTISVSAAENKNPLPSTSSDVRVEVEAKREQITGAESATKSQSTGAQTVLDAPVVTDDAPATDDEK
ncbi:hypothetical protein AUC61_18660 [Pseudomonas sp. S25]|uniref:Secreted protein n=1 Tax=Pseudomonas maioricensis TaxID=1766623 RepID=A0ABS9ZLV1_9PSED|nr:hypothetical protein [Pseudomonas sp. S25]MCI8211555.1 hypothetical protein [Pseudomonas sp. S25]